MVFQESAEEASNWSEDRQRLLRCWFCQITGGASEPLEMHHFTVFKAATSTSSVAHETFLFEHTTPREKVFFTHIL